MLYQLDVCVDVCGCICVRAHARVGVSYKYWNHREGIRGTVFEGPVPAAAETSEQDKAKP